MKKIILYCILSMLFGIFATDKQLEVKGVLVREFSHDELKIGQYDLEQRYPHAIYFDNKGRLSICDSMNSRIVKYNNNYELLSYIKIDQNLFYAPSSYNYEDSVYVYQFSDYVMTMLNKKTKEIIDVAMPHMSSDFTYNHAIFINNTYINWTENNKVYSIQDPQGDDYKKNNLKLQGDEKTMELLRSEEFSSKGYTVDDKKRIFLNGELVTRSFSMFWDYWNDSSEKMIIFGKEADLYAYSTSILLGRDLDGNYIWDAGGIILIFNSHGKFMHYIYEPDLANAILTQMDGDIYYLMNRRYPMKLYKIKRQW